VVCLAGLLLGVVLLAFSPAAARADAMKVLGGGLATFDDVFRLSSYFGVIATVQDDGTTTGEFTCVITDFVIVLGNITKTTVNADGSVRFDGTSDIFLIDGTVNEDVPYAVTVWRGGPKTGKFLFTLDPANPGGDAETILFGGIQIRQ
jgi:hypothetical protein